MTGFQRRWSVAANKTPLLASLLVALFLRLNFSYPDVLLPIERNFAATRIRVLERHRASEEIVLAGINDETRSSGNFNRAVHAQVIANLTKAGVRCVFYDVIFDEPRDPEMDGKLIQSVDASGICVLAAAFTRDQDGVVPPHLIPGLEDSIARGSASLGFVNFDEATTNLALLAVKSESQAGSRTYLSAPLAVYARLQHVLPEQVEHVQDRLLVQPGSMPVLSRREETGDAVNTYYKMGLIFNPPSTGPNGGDPNGFRVIPYHLLKDPSSPLLAQLAGKIVIVGDNSSGDTDVVTTPAGKMKGFESHANLLNTLLDGFYPQQSQPGSQLFLADCCYILLLCTLVSFQMAAQADLKRIVAVWCIGLAAGLALDLGLDSRGYFLNVTLLVSSLIVTLLTQAGLRSEDSRKFLSRFIPEVVANQLLGGGVVKEGEVEATVIVTDIRGYTSLSESKTPREILLMLNEYHTETVGIFEKNGGNVLNYQGDAQIVIFGYPRVLKDAPRAAVKAALATAEAVNALRKRWRIEHKDKFDVGCGICTGPVAVGELGAEGIQSEYTVIGETVRRCHKVQSMSTALEGNVLMDEETYQACKVKPPVKEFPDVQLEGLAYRVTIYRAEAAAQKN